MTFFSWGFICVVIGLWEALYWIRDTGEMSLVLVDGFFFLFGLVNETQREMGYFEFLS